MTVQVDAMAGVARDVEFRAAKPDDAEAIADLYDTVYHGRYPIAECTDPALTRRILQADNHIWMIAVADDMVVGSSVARPEPINSTCELGRAAVRMEYAGRGNFALLFEATVEQAIAQPRNEMIYGYARSERARYLFERIVYRVHWTGTDGGMHRVGDTREEHLIGGSFNPRHQPVRVVPANMPVVSGSRIEQELAAMSGRAVTGEYPYALSGRGPVDFVHETSWGRVGYTLFEPSGALVVGELEAEDPVACRRLLHETVEQAPVPVEHVTLYALADKRSFIETLCTPVDDGNRFCASAYLPGWHTDGTARYDCVTLTQRRDRRRPVSLGLDERVRALHASLPAAYR